ncbi:LuxR C-terminal-related transcriptional regulator [Microbacterium sp. A93]|uniref:helix-turn-helix transcriptional regulator n=1 Tax=Microbacterium sp. A93 TaxID=3450716 RepID=UPI003F42E49E
MSTVWHGDLRLRPTAVDERDLISEITRDLLERGLATAPHVVAKLSRRLNGDAQTVCEVAAALTSAQRSGYRMLPLSLPLVPSISAQFDPIRLSAEEFFVLLLAALCTDDHLDTLLGASEHRVDDLIAGGLVAHLNIVHGRFAFVDVRMPIWLRHTATASERSRAHTLLAVVRNARGDQIAVQWHTARGAVQRLPHIVPALISAARELAEGGHPDWAFVVAAEAADHAIGADRDEARLIAGVAAIGAGCVEDAADWLGSLFPNGAVEHRAQALASLLIAETALQGVVPILDPTHHRPRIADAARWQAWARTAGLSSVLCAERGATSSMRAWLIELRDADLRSGADGVIRDSALALCSTLTRDVETILSPSEGPFSGGMIGALHAALDGDIESGLQLLSRAQTGRIRETDPMVAGFEYSPIVDAYLAVTEALLHFWRGDVATARDRLIAAAVDLPIGIPFAGLGATLAQRLDIAVLGTTGPLAQSLVQTLPGGSRVDRLVDNGLEAYLAGNSERAAMEMTLWHDRGAPQHPFAVPGLDEVGPVIERVCVEPRALSEARGLRRRIRSLPETSWRRECADVADAARKLRSPFARGRVEAMLGSAHLIRGDARAGRRFLRAARSLFDDAGAAAWRDAVDVRLARLHTQIEANAQIATMPIAIIHDVDPLEASRMVWAAVLTERELEVAMRVVEGSSNHEIAVELEVSVRTVEVHTGRIFKKLGVRKRVELAVLAHRTGRHT